MSTNNLIDLQKYDLSTIENKDLVKIEGGGWLTDFGESVGKAVGTLAKNLASLDWTGSFAG